MGAGTPLLTFWKIETATTEDPELGGESSNARRWLAIAERRSDEGFPALGAASTASAVALLRAVMSPAGMQQMRADAEFAVESEAPWSPWHLTAVVALGFSHVVSGDDVRAEEVLAESLAMRSARPALASARVRSRCSATMLGAKHQMRQRHSLTLT